MVVCPLASSIYETFKWQRLHKDHYLSNNFGNPLSKLLISDHYLIVKNKLLLNSKWEDQNQGSKSIREICKNLTARQHSNSTLPWFTLIGTSEFKSKIDTQGQQRPFAKELFQNVCECVCQTCALDKIFKDNSIWAACIQIPNYNT